ncbi:FecCD family ABC transporter permease [Thermohalobacter berrensis]|uniref:Iron ABC transporter n=1 Tax=Thermohalobacter berrensis TaxID=99594 RepID=A0A419SV45_9FIRM|nr:iron chelate uptake ABC transporter family permease subunit [Thermohalobacter berrensis]RKD29090.1 iron ABC transporter [Thermohalobacter berrensis]
MKVDKSFISRKRWNVVLILLVLLLLLSISFFATMGSADITLNETIKIVSSKLPFINKYVDKSSIPDSHQFIILKLRIPRVLLGVLVGAALSCVGAAFQGMFKNPMADPYIIGISSGAALGASLIIITGLNATIFGIRSVSLGAFIGAIASTFIVYVISRVKKRVPITVLLLSGIAVGQFFTAIMSFLMVLHSNDLTRIIFWTLGSFSGKGWNELLPIILPVFFSIVVLNFFARDLNVMLTGEESAQNMGIDVEKIKILILIICALITAMAVSVSGIIGFVGLIVPHIVRLIVGPDHRILIPASALFGGIFMIFADTIARTIIAPTEIPVGIITSLFGGPFFIYLLRKKKRSV